MNLAQISLGKAWYISGAISADTEAHEEANKAQFYRVAAKLRAQGKTVINPVELDAGIKGWSWEDFLARDLYIIFALRPKMYMMFGWQNSKGARLEHALARMLHLHIEEET